MMHAGQLTVDVETVRSLIAAQFPAWAPLPVTPVDSDGTVNAIFRIGEGLAARFPLEPGERSGVREKLEKEAAAAARLAGWTRFPTPEPVASGAPGEGYPLPWSVQTWIPGTVATGIGAGAAFARDLAEFIGAVRAMPTGGRRFSGAGRGGILLDHDEYVAECLRESALLERRGGLPEDWVPVSRLRREWAGMRGLPRGDTPDVMNHGDLMPGNVLIADGRLSGVLDVGGLRAADPALDLLGGWHLLESADRGILRSALGGDDGEWARGRAWAFQQSMGSIWYYAETNPAMASICAER
ncbi:phosphotransferase [Actinoplanes sp. NPDC051851]|uniref:phosphotransferase n=1 Tax=Actinoplanes sp. NPDC051851 TaxID=3154753 RepID=UPI003442A144